MIFILTDAGDETHRYEFTLGEEVVVTTSTYELYDLVDQFVEEAMGKYGRFKLEDETKTIELFNSNEINIKEMIKNNYR